MAILRKNELLPIAIGLTGVLYMAMQAQGAPRENDPEWQTKMKDWEHHVQTGQLVALAALATGFLVYRLKLKS